MHNKYKCLFCHRRKFHKNASNDSLFITINPKDEETFRTAAMLFYVRQSITLVNVAHYSKIHYSTLFKNPLVSDVSGVAASKVRAFVMI
jgi:hypothetical protein